jgi:Zn-dependent protease with chaperone function
MTVRTGNARYFDGLTSERHDVTLELAPHALVIRDRDGAIVDQWSYVRLKHLSAPDHIFRVGLRKNPVLARLEVTDTDLAHEIDLLAPDIDRTGASARKMRRRAIGWACLAAVTLVLSAIYGVPLLADRLAPVIPRGFEQRVGVATNAQIRAMLDKGPPGRPFECGEAPVERAGLAAFQKLARQIEAAANLATPLTITVVRRPEANAFALPGGYVYVFQGLIDKADNVDELAAVIAHEIGHVAHRDGMRAVLQGAGLSFMFGMMLGDFVGGGAVVLAGRTILESAYSRRVENAADRFGVRVMLALGADARALGRFLQRISGDSSDGFTILLDHPTAKERAAAIDAIAPPQSRGVALLDPTEWAALKRICAGYRT